MEVGPVGLAGTLSVSGPALGQMAGWGEGSMWQPLGQSPSVPLHQRDRHCVGWRLRQRPKGQGQSLRAVIVQSQDWAQNPLEVTGVP